MRTFKIYINPDAKKDIQHAINWYNKKTPGLGVKFHSEVKRTFEHLKLNPFFQIRYGSIRCTPLSVFPFMVHYNVDEKKARVIIYAVFHTSMDPIRWDQR